jgi:2-polyprenyl-3-methyl-5-hydroxy-6-metoxy-1,4-benzoquinol methylase
VDDPRALNGVHVLDVRRGRWSGMTAQQSRPEDIAAFLTRLDVVICEQVLEHAEDQRTAVANVRRLARSPD